MPGGLRSQTEPWRNYAKIGVKRETETYVCNAPGCATNHELDRGKDWEDYTTTQGARGPPRVRARCKECGVTKVMLREDEFDARVGGEE